MKNFAAILMIGLFITSCVVVKNNEMIVQTEITPEQACILKNHYLTNDEKVPDAVKNLLHNSDVDCSEF